MRAVVRDDKGVVHAAVAFPVLVENHATTYDVILSLCEVRDFMFTWDAFEYPPSALYEGNPDCMACISERENPG